MILYGIKIMRLSTWKISVSHTFCLMIMSLISSRSPTVTLWAFISRSSRESQSVSSAHALLKSAKAGTSKTTEDGISGVELVVSLVTLVCVSTATVWPEVTEKKIKIKDYWINELSCLFQKQNLCIRKGYTAIISLLCYYVYWKYEN